MKLHEHDNWSDWIKGDDGMWMRSCQEPECQWHQHTSVDPADPDPLNKALNKIVGIE